MSLWYKSYRTLFLISPADLSHSLTFMVYNGKTLQINMSKQERTGARREQSEVIVIVSRDVRGLALETHGEMEKGVPSTQRDSIPRSLAAAPLVLPSHL